MANVKVRIKNGDEVKIIAGKDKGKIGRVLKVLPESRQLLVEGVRRVRRHQRPVGEQPGGIIEKEMPVDVSNVALWNSEDQRTVKVGFKVLDGQKVRVDRKTGNPIDQ
jgi:large subunit ribosomal protein L24